MRSLDDNEISTGGREKHCKDAALISRVHEADLRREWVRRLLDHDGSGDDEGGIERWLRLTDGLGLDRGYVTSMRAALPRRGLSWRPMYGSCASAL